MSITQAAAGDLAPQCPLISLLSSCLGYSTGAVSTAEVSNVGVDFLALFVRIREV